MKTPIGISGKPVYGNYKVLSPEGHLMFRCDDKRANWYLTRNLAALIENRTIRLTFTPKGKGLINDPYGLAEKQNKCVVCGEEQLNLLTRHHVVPACYRRFFPLKAKARASHDIVVICVEHHALYESCAEKLKLELAKQYNAYSKKEVKEITELGKAVKAARTLLNHGATIPLVRTEKLLETIQVYLDKSSPTQKDLEQLARVKPENSKSEYVWGRVVVSKIENLQEFAEMWRQHFLNYTQPQFMPKFWDVKRPILKPL